MSSKIYKVPEDFAALAHLKHADYLRLYQESVRDPHTFWSRIGRRLDWIRPYTQVKDVSYAQDDLHIRWYHDGTLNASANCLDRHLAERGDQTAILWEGDDTGESKAITYRQLDYWARTGLVVPEIRGAKGSGSQRLYSFRDILILKVIKRLLESELIEERSERPDPAHDDERRRYYRLTPLGRRVAESEAARLTRLLADARASGLVPKRR